MKTVTRSLRQRLQTKLGINSGIVREKKKNKLHFQLCIKLRYPRDTKCGKPGFIGSGIYWATCFPYLKILFYSKKKKNIKRKKALFKTFKGDGQIWIRSRKISSLISFLLYWVKSRVNSLKSVIMIMKATQSVFQFNWILQQPMNKHS